jgi:protein gp37
MLGGQHRERNDALSTTSNIEWLRDATGRKGATWNIVVGCDRVSPGCGLAMFPGDQPGICYAIRQANRQRNHPAYEGVVAMTDHGLDWTGRVNCVPERLADPLRWRTGKKIFVDSMGDLFHKNVPTEFIAKAFAVMALATQHRFILLTKQTARMRTLLNDPGFRPMCEAAQNEILTDPDMPIPQYVRKRYSRQWWSDFAEPLRNVWLGVSVERQQEARRVLDLLKTPAAVRVVSAEPLLDELDLRNVQTRTGVMVDTLTGDVKHPIDDTTHSHVNATVDAVFAGGQSGPGAHPAHPDWFRKLRDDCVATGAAFEFKQWGDWGPAPFIIRVCDPAVGWEGTAEELAAAKADAEARGATHVHTGHYRQIGNGAREWHIHEIGHKPWSLERVGLPEGMEPIRRWGKHAAGRVLDGKIWDQEPKPKPVRA